MNKITLNKAMEIEKTIEYLSIIRYALDENSTKPNGIEKINWFDFFQFVTQHEVVGAIYQGILRLSASGASIPKEVLTMWEDNYQRIKKVNLETYKNTIGLVDFFKQDSFDCCVLKGQASALLYSDPFGRVAEGVSVWVTSPNYSTKGIIHYVKQKNPRGVAKYNYCYYGKFRSTDVEVHYRPAYMFNPYRKTLLLRWIREQREQQFRNMVDLPCCIGKISTPTWEFNVITQLANIFGHALNEGFDLRQVIDYYYLLKSARDQEKDKLDISRLLKSFGLQKIASAMMWILHDMLGLEEELLIAPRDEKRGWILLEEVLRGPQRSRYFRGKVRVIRQSRRALHSLKRFLKMLLYYPEEEFWIPFFRIYHFFFWQVKYN
jgi:hypothetical protein